MNIVNKSDVKCKMNWVPYFVYGTVLFTHLIHWFDTSSQSIVWNQSLLCFCFLYFLLWFSIFAWSISIRFFSGAVVRCCVVTERSYTPENAIAAIVFCTEHFHCWLYIVQINLFVFSLSFSEQLYQFFPSISFPLRYLRILCK